MIKIFNRLLSLTCLIVTMEIFTMEQELARTGFPDPNKYPYANDKQQNAETTSAGGVLSYIPTFGLWQNKNEGTNKVEQKDPKSLATWIRDSSVPLVGRGVAGNLQNELNKGIFANVPENRLRVQAAVEDLIDKKQTEELVKLIQSLLEIQFELTQGTIKTICLYLEDQSIRIKDGHVTESKIKITEDYKKTEIASNDLYNQFYPLLIALLEQNKELYKYLDEQSSTVAGKLTEYQQILAKLKPRKYVELIYTPENLNADVELSDTINEVCKTKTVRKEILEKIITLLAEMNNVTDIKNVRELQ